LADTWWDEKGLLYLLKAMVNPWRLPFFEKVLRDHFGADLSRCALLDIGCGGGVLTEEYSKLGCHVTGIDTSEISIQAAKLHSMSGGLEIEYQIGSALDLNFRDNSYDIVSCCDVLEHIPEWEMVIIEISRVLKPNGLFLFDTINRTLLSWFLFIFGLQEWSFTSLFPDGTHKWHMFIKPDEILSVCEQNGISLRKFIGGSLNETPSSILKEVREYKKGVINVAELGKKLVLENTEDLRLNYMGFALKH